MSLRLNGPYCHVTVCWEHCRWPSTGTSLCPRPDLDWRQVSHCYKASDGDCTTSHTLPVHFVDMIHRTLPYFLEDRTGVYSASDFDDIYDRMFLRVSPPNSSSQDSIGVLMVYDTGRRSSSQKDYRPPHQKPLVTLEFGPHGSLGDIAFDGWLYSMPMNQYLKKTSLFRG